jgi:hypothetical protein
MSTPDAIRTRDGFRVLWRQQYAAEVEQFLVRSNMADEDVRSLKEQVLPFRSIRNKDFFERRTGSQQGLARQGSRNYQGQPAWRVST